MITAHVTVDAKVFIDEDEIDMMMKAESISRKEAIEELAMAQVPDGDETHAFKIRDITVY